MLQLPPANRLAVRERPRLQTPVMYQKWRELLFLHWQYDRAALQAMLPSGLQIDTFAGQAYIGIVPFFLHDVRPRFLPAVPGLSRFQEVNLRTYVYDEHGIPGIWFYSLDANQWIAVQAARAVFSLPYVYATIRTERDPVSQAIHFSFARRGTDLVRQSQFRYHPIAARDPAVPGTLEFFLIERYVLFTYSHRQQRLYRGRVHHRPYPLVDGAVTEYDTHLFGLNGLAKPERQPDHVMLSPGVNVEIFSLEEVRKRREVA
jgi:uncharacterized protein